MLYCGRAEEILPQLTERADLLLTDPPYGLGEKWNGGGGGRMSSWSFNPDEAKEWDGETIDLLPVIKYATNAIVWGGHLYSLPPKRGWLVWDKKQSGNWTTGHAELAWTTFDIPVRSFRMSRVEAHRNMNKLHPTQKPIALFVWCIEKIAQMQRGQLILDPFCGVATTLVAAKLLGCRSIGIEMSEKYCELAVKERLNRPLPLFEQGGQTLQLTNGT
jgi:site-specific DNA-methyltransferase (adenine-specific)